MESIIDNFEQTLTQGLIKVLKGAGYLQGEYPENLLPISEDIENFWNDHLIKDYIADAVVNFNDYPEAALSWAGFLGMAVARNWDKDWLRHRRDSYQNFYGSRGFDDMDEYILANILRVKPEEAKRLSDTFLSLALATLGLIQHEGVETQTQTGFYILARCYTVIYKLGAALWLERLGYKLCIR